jgi:hypothetical protein
METGNILIDAQAAFARQRRRRRLDRAGAWLRRSPETSRLTALHDALGAAPPSNRRRAGLRAILPESSRRRWERLWIASRKGAAIPPISVFRLAGEHFVDDGHHRVSVAHSLGMVAIDAEVIELAA